MAEQRSTAVEPVEVIEAPDGAAPKGEGASAPGSELRRAERFFVSGLRCGLGRLTDLSRLGMRLESPWPWRVGRVRTATIRAGRTKKRVRARCVWRRRDSAFRWVMGVQFDDHNKWRLAEVHDLALAHRSAQPAQAA